ncbi:MAG: hypothetical protein K9J30_05945 [Bacteroidales bacterium]|nr:hypothetical protein [Bacteroidales bacterium]
MNSSIQIRTSIIPDIIPGLSGRISNSIFHAAILQDHFPLTVRSISTWNTAGSIWKIGSLIRWNGKSMGKHDISTGKHDISIGKNDFSTGKHGNPK